MNNFFSKNKAVIIAVGIVVAFGIYYFSTKGSAPTDGSLVANIQSDTSQSGAELAAMISSLESIHLDRDQAIFSDPVFTSLVDFSQPIPPQPKGGRNPFSAPDFGGTVATSSGQTK